VSEWGDISICWLGIRIMCLSGVTYLFHYPDSGPTDRNVTPLGHIILIPDQQIDMSPHSDTLSIYLLARNQDNVCPSGVTYLSVGPESG
jgi:hypothetical protein